MEEINAFFASKDGHLLATVLVVMGLVETFGSYFFFSRAIRKFEANPAPAPTQPGQQVPTVASLTFVRKTTMISGTVFTLIGLYGLSR